LITRDTYTSGWAFTDKLYDASVKHWTGKDFPLIGAIEVDDEIYRFMGVEDTTTLLTHEAIQQSVDVQATQTHYKFTCGNVDLQLTFSAPLFLDNLELLSRPVNYISYTVTTNDENSHNVKLYFEAAPNWALDKPEQESKSESFQNGNLVFLKTGSKSQQILAKKGDDVRIDWGYFYMAADKANSKGYVGSGELLRSIFAGNEKIVKSKGENANGNLALIQTLGFVTNKSGKIMIGYDDIYSVQYFNTNLRPYWNRKNNETIISQFQKADKEYDGLIKKCNEFDKKLMTDATVSGGRKYAELCALAYRQSITAHKLAQAPNGDLLFLSKENFSNGSIGTVDVTYPSQPLYLYYNPELSKALLNHIFYYSESGRWTKPFPSHDIGTYPIANGQTYGDDMPIEENGNMLILTGAITKVTGDAAYAQKHWNTMTTWVNYLVENGLDPENQLCTDDFAGHFPHNANLSIKAIMGIASYAYMAEKLNKKDTAAIYMGKAREMARKWVEMADDGDHYRLTFDKPGTWSQKYNMVWDKMLGFNLFPESVAEKEIAYYLTKQNKYGLPLDNRETYTKTDWIIWTATMAKDKATFEKFIDPLYRFMNETVDRIPMSDWVFTDKPKHRGFRARSVVGGYFIKMLSDKLSASR